MRSNVMGGEGRAKPATLLKDRRGRRYGLVTGVEGDRHCLRLYHGPCCVGEARCSWRAEGVLWLDDIGIANEVMPRPRPWDGLLALWWEPEPVSYRDRGLGTALLQSTMDYARGLGAVALVGEVFRPDVENNPGLLDWYGRLGFEQRFPEAGAGDQVAEIYLDLRLWAAAVSSSIH